VMRDISRRLNQLRGGNDEGLLNQMAYLERRIYNYS
jgi:hypothetical protein